MKILRLVLLCVLVKSGFSAFAQKGKVITAFRYYDDFVKDGSKDAELLSKAREAIDAAAKDEDTRTESKTFFIRGQIYYAIYEHSLRQQTETGNTKVTDPNKRALLGYQLAPRRELDSAFASLNRCKVLDTKEKFGQDQKNLMNNVISHYQNKAKADYVAKSYSEALFDFEQVYAYGGKADTATLFNCTVAADRAENTQKTMTYYQQMIENKQRMSLAYNSLVDLLYKTKDSTQANQVLKQGRAALPADVELCKKEINLFITTGRSREALENLNSAIINKPSDELLYFTRGNIYDNMANPRDAQGRYLPRPSDYDANIMKAVVDYQKAIQLNSELFVAVYNLGVIYNNDGSFWNTEADRLSADKAADKQKYDDYLKKSNDAFQKALPQFEKALQLNSKSTACMKALKQIYARLGMTNELNAMNEKLKTN